MAGGRIRIIASAACLPYSWPDDPDCSDWRYTGAVLLFWVMTSAIRKSDQLRMKTKSAVAARPPRTWGSTALKNAPHCEQPSTIAASATSRGTSWKKLLISQTTNEKVTAA